MAARGEARVSAWLGFNYSAWWRWQLGLGRVEDYHHNERFRTKGSISRPIAIIVNKQGVNSSWRVLIHGIDRDTDRFDLFLLTHLAVHSSCDNMSTDVVRLSLDIRYSVLGMPTGRDQIPRFAVQSQRNPIAVTRSAAEWRQLVESIPGAASVANGTTVNRPNL